MYRPFPVVSLLLLVMQSLHAADAESISLNGLEIAIDPGTGGLLRLKYPGPGAMLETTAADAGLVELAYPIEQFEPLRLAPRYSHDAQVNAAEGLVTIHWPRLGGSRPFEFEGEVAATVRLQATPDGRSIVMTCEVENKTPRPIPQVIFPDFRGLAAIAGHDGTELRTCSFVMRPWERLRTGEAADFYADDKSYVVYTPSGACFSEMIGRWLDLGGLAGGMSIFPRRWDWEEQAHLALRLCETDDRLRLMFTHVPGVQPGGKWTSPEFVLTPHRNGWAKGIEPYRAWVREHVKREFPVPRHVREGLGFRTLWMCQNQPNDPTDAIWKFRDLPAAAREAKEHGLDEMVVWFWSRMFTVPFDTPYAHLGTKEELVQATAECRANGVRLVPFISVLQLTKDIAPQYGLQVTGTSGWTYHPELVPRFNPGYAAGFACVQVDMANAKWQDGVAECCARLAGIGLPSICWDQYWPTPAPLNISALTRRIRTEAIKHDPEASFSGEDVSNTEISCNDLDYTWNWRGYTESQAFTNAFPSPRTNINIHTSVEKAKLGFLESLYLNVMPRKPDSINGSDTIGHHQELSTALKTCARLRRQFLPYFVDGTLIGECVLTKPSPGARVAAYVLPDRMLVIVLNRTKSPLAPELECDFRAWLPAGSNAYTVESFDEAGQSAGKSEVIGPTRLMPATALGPIGMALFDIKPR
jgi:hypothetical protein